MACGFLIGMASLGAGALVLPSLRRHHLQGLGWLLSATSMVAIAVPLAGLIFLLWGLLGMALGGLYSLTAQALPGAGLGSPNQAFTLGVCLFALLASLILLLTQKRLRQEGLALNLAFAAIFGWLLPWLAA